MDGLKKIKKNIQQSLSVENNVLNLNIESKN